jgi:hypothetical protein
LAVVLRQWLHQALRNEVSVSYESFKFLNKFFVELGGFGNDPGVVLDG